MIRKAIFEWVGIMGIMLGGLNLNDGNWMGLLYLLVGTLLYIIMRITNE